MTICECCLLKKARIDVTRRAPRQTDGLRSAAEGAAPSDGGRAAWCELMFLCGCMPAGNYLCMGIWCAFLMVRLDINEPCAQAALTQLRPAKDPSGTERICTQTPGGFDRISCASADCLRWWGAATAAYLPPLVHDCRAGSEWRGSQFNILNVRGGFASLLAPWKRFAMSFTPTSTGYGRHLFHVACSS